MNEGPSKRTAAAAAGRPRAPDELPVLRVARTGDALSREALAALTTPQLAAFLARRRWFGAKARAPSSARIRDSLLVPWAGGPFAIARVEIEVAADVPALLYQLPLAVRRAAEFEGKRPAATLARVVSSDEEALLFDAVEDRAFLRDLADICVERRSAVLESGGTRWSYEPLGSGDVEIPADAAVRVGSAEQSNTSVIVGERVMLKLFRKLERGQHPEVEITGFLTLEAAFPHTPRLMGVMQLADAQGASTAGMLQQYLPGSTDAWSFALERARPYFDAPKSAGDPDNAFLADARRLGVVTRELHAALAGGTTDAFLPRPATRAHIERWAARAKTWVRSALGDLERQLAARAIPRERAPEAEALARRRDHYLESVDEIVDTLGDDAGLELRIHGDYHLGQVLRTPDGRFMIIDFEGEPARTLAERREKDSPLRDVAGMLRSFAYAAATLGAAATRLDLPTREIRVGRWERDTREAFLRGYLGEPTKEPAEASRSSMLPSSVEHTRALIRLFETEKAFYELSYELNNRPEWAWIPMRGIAKLLAR